MIPNDLLDHAFGLLDEDDPRVQEFRGSVAADPELLASFERARQRLRLMLEDGPAPTPPSRLASRTMELVHAHRQATEAPAPRIFSLSPTTVPFRWTDLAVAAGILLAGLLTLVPPMHRSRMQASQTLCLANLNQIGTAIHRYAQSHNSYPYPDPDRSDSLCGHYVDMLQSEGFLSDLNALRCPCSASSTPRPEGGNPGPSQRPLSGVAATPLPRVVNTDYAYHRGVQLGDARPEPPKSSKVVGAVVPLLADQPPQDSRGRILKGNSPNHGGWGQNVLFLDNHAGFRRSRWVHKYDADLFLNERRLPAPGIHEYDSSLAPSSHPVLFTR